MSPEEMKVLSELCDSSFLPPDPQGRQESWGQEVSVLMRWPDNL